MKSEFGKGLSYCLALFLCHSERTPMYQGELAKKMGYSEEEALKKDAAMWFYAATDHLYDLQIPDNLPDSLKKRLGKLSKVCFANRLRMDNEVDPKLKVWAIQEAKDLIRLIDKFHGIKTAKGSWE